MHYLADLPVREAAHIAERAITILAHHGLNKGAVHNPLTGAVSLVGALMLAVGVGDSFLSDERFPDIVPQMRRLPTLLVWEYLDAEVDGIEEWEDAPNTTTEDAIRLLRRAADFYSIVIRR